VKFYIIAGEASGDMHAANLVRSLKQVIPKAQFRGWGGDQMSAQGVDLVKHYKELAFMGFVEVISNLRTILKNIDQCKKDIASYKPDAVILVDYPGFNLRIATYIKKQGIPSIYYISPQIWAWKQSRVHAIKRDVDLMLVILPFEQEFYNRFGMDVKFVGHPLLDALPLNSTEKSEQEKFHSDKKCIALLPGSRVQEIKSMLPVMLHMCKHFPEFHFVIAAANHVPSSLYEKYTNGIENIEIAYNRFYDVLKQAHAALVTSGTATLETALMNVPEVVCYKGNLISYWIARKLIKVQYISLVNLISDKEVVKELIQDDFNETNLKLALQSLLDINQRENLIANYDQLRIKLGSSGASERAANYIIQHLQQ